jgi:hypothetical protein
MPLPKPKDMKLRRRVSRHTQKKRTSERGKLVKEADALTRVLVMRRDGERCCRCERSSPEVVIQDAHVYSKGRDTRLRWVLINHLALCLGCHLYWWHKQPLEAYEWFRQKYPERYEQLQVWRSIMPKTDMQELLIGLRLEVECDQR